MARLHASVHEAAHDTLAATRVAQAMAADPDEWASLPQEAQAGYVAMARSAIEALAEHLDRDPAREARAEAVRARLAGALALIDRAEANAEAGDRL